MKDGPWLVFRILQVADEHHLKIVTIKDLIEYRGGPEKLVTRLASAEASDAIRPLSIFICSGTMSTDSARGAGQRGREGEEPVLVRVHSEVPHGDVFGSLRCDCVRSLRTR